MGIIKLNGTEYTSINVQDVLVGGSSVVDPVTKVANVTVPTKTSDLTNDSGFITDNDLIPTDESAVDEFTTLNGGLLQECVVKLEPVQSGSGTPAPDNVRPISGHTEVDLLRVGKNLIKPYVYNTTSGGITVNYTSDGKVTLSGIATAYFQLPYSTWIRNNNAYTRLKAGTYKPSVTQTRNGVIYGVFKADNGNQLSMNGAVFTLTEDTDVFIRFEVSQNVDLSVPFTTEIQIEKGSTATAYEPYKGHLYQIQIGQTVYGGSVDLVTGVMTVDHTIISNLSSYTWDANTRDGYTLYNILPETLTYADGVCTHFEVLKHAYTQGDFGMLIGNNNKHLYSFGVNSISGVSDATSWKQYLADNSVQIVLPVVPFTIQLTPQQISTLIGKNYLSAPLSGQSIDSIEYREVFGFDDVEKATSVKVPISLLGTDEFTSTASKAYSAGDYFYKDGMMCKALTSIAKGATLTLNTNYSASTLADILKILSQ